MSFRNMNMNQIGCESRKKIALQSSKLKYLFSACTYLSSSLFIFMTTLDYIIMLVTLTLLGSNMKKEKIQLKGSIFRKKLMSKQEFQLDWLNWKSICSILKFIQEAGEGNFHRIALENYFLNWIEWSQY